MRPVVFIDTSVLCNFLDIPFMNQDQAAVIEEYRALAKVGAQFIVPIATVIETGNHIEQIANGSDRRRCAQQFAALLRDMALEQAPWVLHEHAWDADLLQVFCDGGTTSPAFESVAATQTLGGGDVSILIERDRYRSRVATADVRVWTKDAKLASYA